MAAAKWATLRSQWLGQQLRELREVNGLLLKEVAEFLQRDPGTVSRFESGVYPVRRPELLAMLSLYGVTEETRRQRLLQLGDDVWRKGWWDGFAKDVADTMVDYVWLESRSEHIQTFGSIIVPGLLQTEEYAKQVMRANAPETDPKQMARWLELRLVRQKVLTDDNGTAFTAVLSEATLRRQIGKPEVMAAQLGHLIDLTRLPNVDLRVLPFRTEAAVTTYGSFGIFQMPDPFPEVGYAETLGGAVYVEWPEVQRFALAYDGLLANALDTTDSAALIAALRKEWR